jgi:hypothetical protein
MFRSSLKTKLSFTFAVAVALTALAQGARLEGGSTVSSRLLSQREAKVNGVK